MFLYGYLVLNIWEEKKKQKHVLIPQRRVSKKYCFGTKAEVSYCQ